MKPRKEACSLWAPVPLASGAEAMAGRRAKVTRTPVRFQGTPLSQKPRECDGSAQCLLVYDRPVPCLLRRGLRPPAAGVTLALLLGLGALPATAVSKPPTTLDALLLPGRKLPLPGAQGEQARVPKLVQRMRGGGDLPRQHAHQQRRALIFVRERLRGGDRDVPEGVRALLPGLRGRVPGGGHHVLRRCQTRRRVARGHAQSRA